ncbi:MAG TPA: hypothetical protein VNB90_06780 [Cytophagaceae bacterium]|jgi:hypothetical protein|nr:hypothetical protein [Cytophagaceae bacterium]
MIKTTTQNEIILNVYKENSESSQEDFQTECVMNSTLSEERDEFEDIKISLEALSFQPRQKSIDAILNYSVSFMKIQ